MKRILLFLMILVIAMCSVSMVACDNTPDPVNPDTPAVPEKTVGSFIVDGKTDYKIAYSQDDADISATAVRFVESQLNSACGVALQTEENLVNASITKDSTYIVFGANLSQLGLDVSEDVKSTLIKAGYRIQTYHRNVLINAYSEHGYQLAAIAFLREAVGYDMLSEDLVIYEKDGSKMPQINLTEKSDYDYVMPPNSMSTVGVYGSGFVNTDQLFSMQRINGMPYWIHNCMAFVDEADVTAAKNGDEEKEKWFSSDYNQLCYTGHGDQAAYEALVEKVVEKAIWWYKKDWDENKRCTPIMSITQADNTSVSRVLDLCECDACTAAKDYYGSGGGANLMFINDVSKRVNEYLSSPEGIEYFGGRKRELSIAMLAYRANLTAPVEKDANGNMIPKIECRFDESGNKIELQFDANGNRVESGGQTRRIQCADNVTLMYAASSANYYIPFNDRDYNGQFLDQLEGWSMLNGEMFVYAYQAYYNAYIYPYNSWYPNYKSMQFFYDIGTTSTYWQGHSENMNHPGFTKLKSYLISKIGFDVDCDYQGYVNKFFKYYFGAGGEYMYKYFNELQLYIKDYIDPDMDLRYAKQHTQAIADKKYWPVGLMNTWLGYIEQAEKAIEQEKNKDPEKYEIYKKHLLIESLFPRYALCDLHADSYSESEITEMRKAFKRDFVDVLSNKTHLEHFTFNEKLVEWGLA